MKTRRARLMKHSTYRRPRLTLVGILYKLPFLFFAVCVVIVLWNNNDAWVLPVAFPGAFAVAVIIHFPFIAIYWAILSFLHALTEEIRLPAAQRQTANLLCTLAVSLLTGVCGILTLLCSDLSLITFLLMIVGLCGCLVCRVVRLAGMGHGEGKISG